MEILLTGCLDHPYKEPTALRVSEVSTLYASASQVGLRADRAGTRGEEVFPGDPVLTQKDCRAVRSMPASTESLPQISLGARILLVVCQALAQLVDWGLLEHVHPAWMTKSAICCCQLSRAGCLGMQAELLALVKIGQAKAKGTMMLTQLISLLPTALNAANYC